MGFESTKPPPSNIRKVNADAFTIQIEEIQKILQDNMLIAQADYECHANQDCGLAFQYKIRDLVWLDTRNLFTKLSSKKLQNCHVGKYQVKRIISNYAIKLNFSSDLHIHLVFHVTFLEPATTDDLHSSHVQFLGPPIKVNKETEYKSTAIVDSRLIRKTKKL